MYITVKQCLEVLFSFWFWFCKSIMVQSKFRASSPMVLWIPPPRNLRPEWFARVCRTALFCHILLAWNIDLFATTLLSKTKYGWVVSFVLRGTQVDVKRNLIMEIKKEFLSE